ncbi:hypothetical protein [Absidia glauca]|uniref:Uncharacterized protein n=1 Tax=Absidia glauca TaxID=4829 RepID=A0A163KSJ5_ABSGL|nr:hypothetical protein [Absidia glauca]
MYSGSFILWLVYLLLANPGKQKQVMWDAPSTLTSLGMPFNSYSALKKFISAYSMKSFVITVQDHYSGCLQVFALKNPSYALFNHRSNNGWDTDNVSGQAEFYQHYLTAHQLVISTVKPGTGPISIIPIRHVNSMGLWRLIVTQGVPRK